MVCKSVVCEGYLIFGRLIYLIYYLQFLIHCLLIDIFDLLVTLSHTLGKSQGRASHFLKSQEVFPGFVFIEFLIRIYCLIFVHCSSCHSFLMRAIIFSFLRAIAVFLINVLDTVSVSFHSLVQGHR